MNDVSVVNKNLNKERNSGFELMRIISMFLIVIWHTLIHGRIIDNSTGGLHVVLLFIQMLCLVHVNSYVLVSGYYQCKSKFNANKVVNLLFSSWFYRILITFLFIGMGFLVLSKHDIINNVLFITGNGYWFLANYIIIYILSPFINIFINKLTKTQYKYLLLIAFLLGSVVGSINYPSDYSFFATGYNVIFFIFLYLVGGYFRNYPINESSLFKNKNKYITGLLMILLYIFFISINFLLSFFANYISGIGGEAVYIGSKINLIILNYNCPFTVFASICYFLFFSILKFKNKIINFISKYMLDIYMIHDNFPARAVIYILLGFNQTVYSSYYTVIKLFLVVIIIFVVAGIIGVIKDYLFKIISKIKLFKKFHNFIKSLGDKYNKLFDI